MNFEKFTPTLFGSSQELQIDLFNPLVISVVRIGPKIPHRQVTGQYAASPKVKVTVRIFLYNSNSIKLKILPKLEKAID